MNSVLLLASFVLLLAGQVASHSCNSGSGNSCEAEKRKQNCGDLVDEPEKSGSHEVPATVATPPPGECICTPAPGSGSGSGEFHSECILIEALYNISITLSVEQQAIFIEFIRSIEINILADFSLSNEEKIIAVAYELKKFFKLHYEIKIAIGYELIADWGYVVDLETVAVDLQSDNAGKLIDLGDGDDCDLFEGLRNATEGDSEKESAVLVLIEELRVILIDVSLTYEEKLTLVYEKFEAFFELHAEWEEFFLEIEILGFGSLEQFIDVCHVYNRTSHISVVLGGSVSENVLIQALDEAFQNASFSLSVRSQISQIKVKLEAYFESESDVYLRLGYVSAQLYQFFKLESFIVQYVSRVSLGEWGDIHDLLFCAAFFKTHGWEFPATATSEATTVEASTADLSCVKRGRTISIDGGCNCTDFTDSVNREYNTWGRNDKSNFASYKKRIETIIWGNEFPAESDKLAQIVTVLTGFSTPGQSTYDLVMGIDITGWGLMKKFCDCQNAPNHD